MPDAAVIAEIRYIGDGRTTTFSVPFEYLSKSHIRVTVDDVVIPFTWLTAHSIQLTTAPALNTVVLVKRNTPYNELWVQWRDGSVLFANELMAQNHQLLFIMQESFASAIQQTVHNEYVSYINQTVNQYTFLAPIILPTDTTTLTLTANHAARRIIFTSPNPCTILLPQEGLIEGFHCLVRNSGGGSLKVQTVGAAVIENSIRTWSDPTKYGSIMLETFKPYYTFFLMGGLEE